MSFVKQSLRLNGTANRPVHQLKTCSKCEQERVPEGGIETGPGRWVCAICWTRKASARRK